MKTNELITDLDFIRSRLNMKSKEFCQELGLSVEHGHQYLYQLRKGIKKPSKTLLILANKILKDYDKELENK